jgi:hypothetical protein
LTFDSRHSSFDIQLSIFLTFHILAFNIQSSTFGLPPLSSCSLYLTYQKSQRAAAPRAAADSDLTKNSYFNTYILSENEEIFDDSELVTRFMHVLCIASPGRAFASWVGWPEGGNCKTKQICFRIQRNLKRSQTPRRRRREGRVHGIGWPWTLVDIIARARHALTLYSLRAATPGRGSTRRAGGLRLSSTPLDTLRHTSLEGREKKRH